MYPFRNCKSRIPKHLSQKSHTPKRNAAFKIYRSIERELDDWSLSSRAFANASATQALNATLDVDLNVYTCWEVKLLELVYRRCSWLNDVDEALVRADFELVHRLLVYVR